MDAYCPDRTALVVQLAKATVLHAQAVGEFAQYVAAAEHADSAHLAERCDKTKAIAEQARLDLERHEAEHGCNNGKPSR